MNTDYPRKSTRTAIERSICEVHRELYDWLYLRFHSAEFMAAHDDQEVWDKSKLLLEESFAMGISLVQKLLDYNIQVPQYKRTPNKRRWRIRRLRAIRNALEDAQLEPQI
jgi:hypothetical protein